MVKVVEGLEKTLEKRVEEVWEDKHPQKAKVEETQDDKQKRDATEMWNDLILGIIQARDAWNEYAEQTEHLSSTDVVTLFPIKAQRMMARFRRFKFEIFLPKLVDYVRSQVGSLEELIIKEEEE